MMFSFNFSFKLHLFYAEFVLGYWSYFFNLFWDVVFSCAISSSGLRTICSFSVRIIPGRYGELMSEPIQQGALEVPQHVLVALLTWLYAMT